MSTNDVSGKQLPKGAGTGSNEVPARAAASVLVLRDDPLRVLLMKRHEGSTFVPGSWVFPGGTVDDSDRVMAAAIEQSPSELLVARVCAVRELFEETGLWIGEPFDDLRSSRRHLLDRKPFAELGPVVTEAALSRLVWTARWITPLGVPKRFDTWFFLLRLEGEHTLEPDQEEGVELRWIEPSLALQEEKAGEMSMVFPTIRNLQAIASFQSASELIESRRDATIPTIQPILVIEGDRRRIVLPGEP